MADNHHLVYAIIKFLNSERDSGKLSEDAAESLEVAAQCLETAYEVNAQDEACAARFPMPSTLDDVFQHGLNHYGIPLVTTAPSFDAPAPAPVQVSEEMKETAEKHKADGNEFMKQEKFQEALKCYSDAIEIDGSNAVYYCNRAAAHSKLNNNQEALADCEKALNIDPNYSKAYGRKGLAHSALNQHQQAIECYKKALELDPGNPSYKQNLDIAEKKSSESAGPGVPPGGAAGGLNLGGLDFSSMLSNPALMNMATNMMQNPQIQSMMANLMTGTSGEGGGGMANLLQAGQHLAQQMQQTNPDLVDQLRGQMRNNDDSDQQNPDEN